MSMSCDSFRFHKCTTQQNHQSKIFLFLLVLIGWLTRFRKSQGYTHFKIYQFESSRLECLLRAKFLWTDTLDFIVFDPSHLITRPKIKIFRKLQNWFEFCWGWQEEREEKNIFLFAVEKFSHGLFLSDDVTMRMPHMTLLLLSPNK